MLVKASSQTPDTSVNLDSQASPRLRCQLHARETIAIAFTFAACLTFAAYVVSYVTPKKWQWDRTDWNEEENSSYGYMGTFSLDNGTLSLMVTELFLRSETQGSSIGSHRIRNVLTVAYIRSPSHRTFGISMTLAWLFALFAIYPAFLLVRSKLRRRRRRIKGLCVKCSYDLTGNVTGVCPECGTAK